MLWYYKSKSSKVEYIHLHIFIYCSDSRFPTPFYSTKVKKFQYQTTKVIHIIQSRITIYQKHDSRERERDLGIRRWERNGTKTSAVCRRNELEIDIFVFVVITTMMKRRSQQWICHFWISGRNQFQIWRRWTHNGFHDHWSYKFRWRVKRN